jgi:hypothetical protein
VKEQSPSKLADGDDYFSCSALRVPLRNSNHNVIAKNKSVLPPIEATVADIHVIIPHSYSMEKVTRLKTPASGFDTIESTQQFNELFQTAIAETLSDVQREIAAAQEMREERRLEALLLVFHKLEKLNFHVGRSRRLLNDLRTLRRLLFEERETRKTT